MEYKFGSGFFVLGGSTNDFTLDIQKKPNTTKIIVVYDMFTVNNQPYLDLSMAA